MTNVTVQEALKAAIEALEKHQDCYGGHAEIVERCKAAIFEIEKCEPVAWKYKTNKVHTWITEVKPPDDAYDDGTLAPLYTSPQPTVQREGWVSVPSYEMVLSYLYSLDTEMSRRGGMFPQESSGQDKASDALHQTADSVKFYGEQGYPLPKQVLELKECRARNSAAPKE